MRSRRSAFTLIELLVVVAILSLLLAIFSPSLRRGRYVTRLAVCASNLHGVATGVNTFASNHRGAYPPRIGVPRSWKCNHLSGGGVGDDRDFLRDYMMLDVLNCPLTGQVNFTTDDPTTNVYSTYDLWFGWQLWGPGGGEGMTHQTKTLQYAGFDFDILACDRDIFNPSGAWVHGTHPDADGVMWNEVLDSQAVENVAGSVKFTLSRWITYTTNARGPIDRNFAHTDGSVDRITEVVLNDPRMVILPEFAGSGLGWAVCQLPPKD